MYEKNHPVRRWPLFIYFARFLRPLAASFHLRLYTAYGAVGQQRDQLSALTYTPADKVMYAHVCARVAVNASENHNIFSCKRTKKKTCNSSEMTTLVARQAASSAAPRFW